jgi:Skp family chaperone for outer membrane proteins
MSFRHYLAAAALIVPVLSFAPLATAADTLEGPALPGICLLSREAVFDNAKVGVAAIARLRELAQTGAAPLNAERESIASEERALQAQKPADAQAKQRALTQRYNTTQVGAQRLQRQLELTEAKARNQIAQVEGPAIEDAYRAHNCGLLLNRQAVLGGNMSNDLTREVVQGLDAKMTTITFDLEPFTAPAAGAPQ